MSQVTSQEIDQLLEDGEEILANEKYAAIMQIAGIDISSATRFCNKTDQWVPLLIDLDKV